jgi:type I restriction enzyme S subunit
MGSEVDKWESRTVMDLQNSGIILVEDGNHGNNRPLRNEFGSTGTSFIRAADMAGGRLLFDTAEKVNDNAMARVRKGIGAGGDVILSHKGTVGKVAFVPLESQPFVCSPQTTFWRTLANNVLDRRYLCSFLGSRGFRVQLDSLANETDMAAYVSLTSQRTLSVVLPPIHIQRAIAHILGSLDDRIELNRRMNATLEGMAQALFKSWFVDFDPVIDNALVADNPIPEELTARAELRRTALDNGTANRETAKPFPDAFVETEELGWIPAGWEVTTVGEQIESVGGGTPSTKNPEYWDGTYPFCTPKDMSKLGSMILTDTERHLTDSGVAKVSSRLLPIGTVVMSSRAPIGYIAITQEPVAINQGIIALRQSDTYPAIYLVNWLNATMPQIKDRANGSTFQEISKTNFRPIPFLKAGHRVLTSFGSFAQPIEKKAANIARHSTQLTKLRDTLLPKLISGELRIPDAEKLAEAALA